MPFHFSSEVLRDILDMDPNLMPNDPDFAEWVSGNRILEGSAPMAHRYGGHQFGSWVRPVTTYLQLESFQFKVSIRTGKSLYLFRDFPDPNNGHFSEDYSNKWTYHSL